MTQRGFTLIELMITVAILAIVAAIAYPAYTSQVRKTQRADAKAALMRTAQVLERCYTEFNAYNDSNCPAVDNTDNTKLATAYTTTENGYYTLSATTLTATAFTLQATRNANGPQKNDKCGDFTFNHIGATGVVNATGVTAADCW